MKKNLNQKKNNNDFDKLRSLNIFNSEGKPFQVSLSNVPCKNILTNQYDGKIPNCQIETNGLNNSIYFATIRCGDKVNVEKLIIQAKADY